MPTANLTSITSGGITTSISDEAVSNLSIGVGVVVRIGGPMQTYLGTDLASDVTINGGELYISRGATVTGILVNSGTLYVGYGTSLGAKIRAGGVETLSYGSDKNSDVYAGGVYSLGPLSYSDYAVFHPGSIVSAIGDVQFSDVTVDAGVTVDLTQSLPRLYGATTLHPGSTLDFAGVITSVSLDQSNNFLSLNGEKVAVLQGYYADDTFSLSDDGNPAHGTLVTLTEKVSGGFNNSGNTTFQNLSSDASVYASYAHYYIATAGTTGAISAGVYSTDLDNQGDKAVFSTVNSPGHTLAVNGTGRSVVAAGSGNDTVTAANGNDLIATGAGSNTVYLVTGANILASQGNDAVYIGSGSDTISAVGNLTIVAGNATLDVFLNPNAVLTLHTGIGAVHVEGGFGSGEFSGGTNGHNRLTAGTGPTILDAGGDGDTLIASGGSTTTMNGWGGAETMVGQYSQGTDVFNFNGANVFATGGAGANVFNVGSGSNNIVSGLGRDLFNFTNGTSGGNTYVADFKVTVDRIHLTAYASEEVSSALATATSYQGSEILHLRDGTSITFGNVAGLQQSSFV